MRENGKTGKRENVTKTWFLSRFHVFAFSFLSGSRLIAHTSWLLLRGDSMASPAIVLFDGVCNLCHSSVNFVIERDARAYFRFASLQSEVGQTLMKTHGLASRELRSVVLIEDGKAYESSTAALRIAWRLTVGWRLLYLFILIPRPVRDAVYKWVAKHRYRWFGVSNTCLVPTPERRARFLDKGLF